jgi:hypothetical protein
MFAIDSNEVCSTCTTLSVSVDQFVDKLSVRIFHADRRRT